MILSIFCFIAAASLSASAAFYSISGLVSIFPGASLAIMVMGGSMEFGKIVATIWLHKFYNQIPRLFKYYVCSTILVLMAITSMGIYGFLSKSHLESNSGGNIDYINREYIESKIKSIESNIEKNQRTINQLESSFDVYIESGSITRGLRERNKIKSEMSELKNTILELETERDKLKSSLLEVDKNISLNEVETGPIKYIASLIYNGDPKDNMERAVILVMVMLIFVFDPFAISLMIMSQIAFNKRNIILEDKPDQVDVLNLDGILEEPTEVEDKYRSRKARIKSTTHQM